MVTYRDCGYVVGMRLLGLNDEWDGWLDHDGDIVGASNQHILDRHTPLPAAATQAAMLLQMVFQEST